MISEPSVCMGALWIPYRRDKGVMRNVLKEGMEFGRGDGDGDGGGAHTAGGGGAHTTGGGGAHTTGDGGRECVSTIFCHADVKGAFMNDGMRCRDGLDLSSFPAGDVMLCIVGRIYTIYPTYPTCPIYTTYPIYTL